MLAGFHRRVVSRPQQARNPAPDAGFTLTEVLVAMMLIGVVMAALTTFYANSMSIVSYQRGKQTAIQLASSGVERVRALKGSDLATPPPGTPPPSCSPATPFTGVDPSVLLWAHDCVTLGTSYDRYWYVGKCWKAPTDDTCTQTTGAVEFFRVVVAVTWRDKSCQNSACSYATSTLVSGDGDPLFDSAAKAPPPKVNPTPDQEGYVGELAQPVQVTASGSAPPLTLWATGLPDKLGMDSSGLITGTPSTAGVFMVTATATDGFDNTGSASFKWTVAALPQLANPGVQNTTKGAPFTLDLNTLLTGGFGKYAWSLTGPAAWAPTGLPSGLALNASTGMISGTPQATTGPPKDVTITVRDKNGKTATTTFGLSVVPRIITYSVPRTDYVGDYLSLQANVDGSGPFSWSAANLPDGLSMDRNGLITGTVARGSRWVSTITVTDKTGATGSLTFWWATIYDWWSSGLELAGPVERTDPVGKYVSLPTTASGGTGPYTRTLSGQPAGVTLNGRYLEGTPNQAGTYTVTVTVTDAKGKTAKHMFVWTIQ